MRDFFIFAIGEMVSSVIVNNNQRNVNVSSNAGDLENGLVRTRDESDLI